MKPFVLISFNRSCFTTRRLRRRNCTGSAGGCAELFPTTK